MSNHVIGYITRSFKLSRRNAI